MRRRKKTLFKTSLLIYTIVGLILSIIFLVYIYLTLKSYEASQTDNYLKNYVTSLDDKTLKKFLSDNNQSEDLLVDYKLKPGVVNVLLDYAINVNNKKLTRGFVETIAGEWQRKGIETVEDAMNNCEKVHKKSSKRNYKDDNVNMKTPDWFDKEINKSNVSDGEENQLEELLKEYK